MSFLRRLSASFQGGNALAFASTPEPKDLSPRIKDDVFRWQIGAKDFACIDADTLMRADIVGGKQMYAKKVINVCHELGIVDPVTGRPNTSKVDRSMVSKMPIISLPKQRELIMLLFWWEEELSRWRLIAAEEEQIENKLRESDIPARYRSELQMTLQMLQGERRVWPSNRNESGLVYRHEDEQLPTYAEARAQRYA